MDDRYPFSVETLVGVPRFAYSNSYMSKIDDKSGYVHILLSRDSQQYFGIEWQGWWLVGVSLPFRLEEFSLCISNCWTGPRNFFQEFRGSMFSLHRRSIGQERHASPHIRH